LTRVFFLGKIKVLGRRVYEVVLEAQRRAIAKIKPGVEICELDAAARGYIAEKGFGKFFEHSLGHGIGLEIHEPPRINPKPDTFRTGMVATVEPGLYYLDAGGMRIEDMVLVTKNGCRILTKSPKILEV